MAENIYICRQFLSLSHSTVAPLNLQVLLYRITKTKKKKKEEKGSIGSGSISQCPRDTNKELELLGNYFFGCLCFINSNGGPEPESDSSWVSHRNE